MTHRARPRVQFVTGGPSPAERRSQGKRQPTSRKKLPKQQRAALAQLDASISSLKTALRQKQIPLARQLRSAAWEQADLLPPHLTWEQRQALFQCKQKLRALEQQARGSGGAGAPAAQDRTQRQKKPLTKPARPAEAVEPGPPRVWVRPPDADRIQEQRRASAARLKARVEKERKEAAAAKRIAAAVKAAGKSKKQPRVVRVNTSVRTVSGGLPTLGKNR